MGGGNSKSLPLAKSGKGLSPRGRGKPSAGGLGRPFWRSIPAWAGETVAGFETASPPGVYPRVGGGNPYKKPEGGTARGLSPRGRGKLLRRTQRRMG